MKSSFPQRRPLLFTVALLLVILVTYVLAGAITTQLKLPTLAIIIIGDAILALVAILLLSRLHWWREVGFHLPSNPRYWWFFTIPLLSVILNIVFAGVGSPGVGPILLFLAIALTVGCVEEVFFRGMMLRSLVLRGPWQAVIISSLAFGFLHLLNVAGGANLAATLLQMVYALAIGLMYAALALRTRTILPLIVTHALTNFFAYLALNSTFVTTGVDWLRFAITAGEIIIFIAYSLILMRQVKPQARGVGMGTPSMPTLAHEELA